ncbi:MAG: hypothetical protein ACOCSD_07845 [Halolamina sp.]
MSPGVYPQTVRIQCQCDRWHELSARSATVDCDCRAKYVVTVTGMAAERRDEAGDED